MIIRIYLLDELITLMKLLFSVCILIFGKGFRFGADDQLFNNEFISKTVRNIFNDKNLIYC